VNARIAELEAQVEAQLAVIEAQDSQINVQQHALDKVTAMEAVVEAVVATLNEYTPNEVIVALDKLEKFDALADRPTGEGG
jgi:hypothetical protein